MKQDARFFPGGYRSVSSAPITIKVGEPSETKVVRNVGRLIQTYRKAQGRDARRAAIERLVYTRNSRGVPELIACEYARSLPDLTDAAFMWYLPISTETRDMIRDAAMERGVTRTMFLAMRRFGCSEADVTQAVVKTLGSDDSRLANDAALIARDYPSDHYTTAMTELAIHGEDRIREIAFQALASNRTEEGVSVLKEALNDPDEKIRSLARNAVEIAYWSNDYLSRIRKNYEVAASAKMIARSRDWLQLEVLLTKLREKDYAAVKRLAEHGGEYGDAKDPNEPVSSFAYLLRDCGRDIRDVTLTMIRTARRVDCGCPLKPEDFPEIYADCLKEKKEN